MKITLNEPPKEKLLRIDVGRPYARDDYEIYIRMYDPAWHPDLPALLRQVADKLEKSG